MILKVSEERERTITEDLITEVHERVDTCLIFNDGLTCPEEVLGAAALTAD